MVENQYRTFVLDCQIRCISDRGASHLSCSPSPPRATHCRISRSSAPSDRMAANASFNALNSLRVIAPDSDSVQARFDADTHIAIAVVAAKKLRRCQRVEERRIGRGHRAAPQKQRHRPPTAGAAWPQNGVPNIAQRGRHPTLKLLRRSVRASPMCCRCLHRAWPPAGRRHRSKPPCRRSRPGARDRQLPPRGRHRRASASAHRRGRRSRPGPVGVAAASASPVRVPGRHPNPANPSRRRRRRAASRDRSPRATPDGIAIHPTARRPPAARGGLVEGRGKRQEARGKRQ